MKWLTVLVAAMGLLWAESCGEAPKAATLYEVSSAGVTVNDQPAKAQQKIGVSDRVVVASKGAFARLLLSDGTKIFLLPDDKIGETRFTLDKYTQDGSTRQVLLRLMQGVVTLLVPKNRPKGDILEVQASFTTTAIRGTELKITSSPEGDTIALKEGSVEVRSNKDPAKTQTVSIGEQVRFDAKTSLLSKSTYNPFDNAESALFRDSGVPVRTTIEQ